MPSIALALKSCIPLAIWAACTFSPASAAAAAPCTPTAQADVERCVVGLSPLQMQEVHQFQLTEHWCWAASVAMVLRLHQLRVDQAEVVEARYAAHRGASREDILDLLNRTWKDRLGRTAHVSAGPLPHWRAGFGLLAPEILADLAAGKPVLVGAKSHATVLVQVVFERTRGGSAFASGRREQLVSAVVMDPATRSVVRTLTAAETAPEFALRVAVRHQPSATAPLHAAANLVPQMP